VRRVQAIVKPFVKIGKLRLSLVITVAQNTGDVATIWEFVKYEKCIFYTFVY
jgi:hypothetical protein